MSQSSKVMWNALLKNNFIYTFVDNFKLGNGVGQKANCVTQLHLLHKLERKREHTRAPSAREAKHSLSRQKTASTKLIGEFIYLRSSANDTTT